MKARDCSLQERMKFLRALLALICILCSLGLGRAGKQKSRVGTELDGTTTKKNATTTIPSKVPERNQPWSWSWRKKEGTNEFATSFQQPSSTDMEVAPEHHKKQRQPKNGKQKIANCRHLTSLSTSFNSTKSTDSQLSRLWRKLPLKKYVTKYIGRSLVGNKPNIDMNVAYAMGVVATLSYWDFHKKALPDNRSSFELLTLKQGTPKPLRRRKRDKALSMVLSGMRVALDEASPWLSLLPPSRQKRTRYREKLRTQLEERISSRQHRHNIQLEYFFYNWYEPTPLGNYHDTDLLLATCNNGKTLIVAFAGTASVPDTVTNLQTFEPVQHSGLFHRDQKALKGSIHRGFLNAYSRVERGSVLRLCDESNCTLSSSALHRRYSHCVAEASNMEAPIPAEKDFDHYDIEAERKMQKYIHDTTTTVSQETREESILRKRGRRGCKIKDKKLMTILRELVVDYLTTSGRSVLLAGHSLGGSLATLHALDIIINFPNVPVNKLEVWTFGGAQVSDDAFLESALAVAPRLQHFLDREQTFLKSRTLARAIGANQKGRSQFHRFVSKCISRLNGKYSFASLTSVSSQLFRMIARWILSQLWRKRRWHLTMKGIFTARQRGNWEVFWATAWFI